jgi:hypothetical protein
LKITFQILLSIWSALALPMHGFLFGGFREAQKPGGHDPIENCPLPVNNLNRVSSIHSKVFGAPACTAFFAPSSLAVFLARILEFVGLMVEADVFSSCGSQSSLLVFFGSTRYGSA